MSCSDTIMFSSPGERSNRTVEDSAAIVDTGVFFAGLKNHVGALEYVNDNFRRFLEFGVKVIK